MVKWLDPKENKVIRASASCEPKPGSKFQICVGNQSAASARQIANHLEKIPHKTYVEPFLGLGNVWRAQRNHNEKEKVILNDIDCARTEKAKQKVCSTKSQTKCDYIKKAELTCGKDYKPFLKANDNKDTLFYLDPPYHNKLKDVQYQSRINFNDFVQDVKDIKNAKVAISYSDTPDFTKEFCNRETGYTCHKIKKNVMNKAFYNDVLAIKK